MTPPCGVPLSLRFTVGGLPFSVSTTGAFSHIRISFNTEPSVTRIRTQAISLSCGMLSKYPARSASYTAQRPCLSSSPITFSASCAERSGRNPWEQSLKSASKIGSRISSVASGLPDPAPWGRSALTALNHNPPWRSAKVTHPYHPLRGRSFPVLKSRTVSGVQTLILRGTRGGTFAIAQEWTDWAEPSPSRSLESASTAINGLLLPSLIEWVGEIKSRAAKLEDKNKREKRVDTR